MLDSEKTDTLEKKNAAHVAKLQRGAEEAALREATKNAREVARQEREAAKELRKAGRGIQKTRNAEDKARRAQTRNNLKAAAHKPKLTGKVTKTVTPTARKSKKAQLKAKIKNQTSKDVITPSVKAAREKLEKTVKGA
jgi:hypothetical protein